MQTTNPAGSNDAGQSDLDVINMTQRALRLLYANRTLPATDESLGDDSDSSIEFVD